MATTEQDSLDSGNTVPEKSSSIYEIKVKGLLDAHWLDWFDGMTLEVDEQYDAGQGCTLIIGPIADQPALHGLLEKIRDLNLMLISVRKLPPVDSEATKQDQSLKKEDPCSGHSQT